MSEFAAAIKARTERRATDVEVEKIVAAFAEGSGLDHIAARTGIPKVVVRTALESPDIASRAMRLKKNVIGIWLTGEALDSLQDIVRDAKAPNHVLKAVELMQTLLHDDRPDPDAPQAEVASVEAAIESFSRTG